MTIEELGQALLELCRTVAEGIGGIFRCIGDLMIENASKPSSPLPSNSLQLFSNIIMNRILFFALIAYILFINIFTFIRFASDKAKARRREFRISERNLLMLCIIGGAVGGLLGMKQFRHKTQRMKFEVAVPVLAVIQIALYCFSIGFLSFWAFF